MSPVDPGDQLPPCCALESFYGKRMKMFEGEFGYFNATHPRFFWPGPAPVL
jgi:hypothetical protein